MEQKVLKTGNSLAVTIPSNFAKTLGIRPGKTVHAKINLAKGQILLTFGGIGQMSLLPNAGKVSKI